MLANFDEIFLTQEQAEEELGVHVLGMIPMIEEEGLRLIRNTSRFSPLMESYRWLRTSIYFATVDRPVRTLLVTSSVPAEGKSTTVANLASALALDNKKVIVLDTDLRRPQLHKSFETSAWPGVTDVLVGTHGLVEVLRETTEPLVRFIPAGSPPPNPAELLGSPAMRQFLTELEGFCDIVLLDSPPCAVGVADSLVLATRVNGVLLVIGEETRKRNVRMAMTVLSRARANVIGTAFNRIEGVSGSYYYGKYYVPTETPEGDSTENSPQLAEDPTEHEEIVFRKPERDPTETSEEESTEDLVAYKVVRTRRKRGSAETPKESPTESLYRYGTYSDPVENPEEDS
jgi:capsular exopolysaccharide synthesis family protein